MADEFWWGGGGSILGSVFGAVAIALGLKESVKKNTENIEKLVKDKVEVTQCRDCRETTKDFMKETKDEFKSLHGRMDNIQQDINALNVTTGQLSTVISGQLLPAIQKLAKE